MNIKTETPLRPKLEPWTAFLGLSMLQPELSFSRYRPKGPCTILVRISLAVKHVTRRNVGRRWF